MTTINEALTPLGDGFRNLYRTGDKYSAADMAKLLSSLEIHNFLDDGQYFDSKVDNANEMSKELRGMDVAKWNEYLLGKTVIFSCDIEWSDFDVNNGGQKRVGYEFQTSAEDDSVHYNGTWLYPTTPSGKQYCATKMKIYDKPIQHVDYGSMYNQINSDATVKITNVKMYIDPLGGVAPLGLFNPDLSKWYHPGIQLISQDGYQVAILPPDGSQFQTTPSWLANKSYSWTFEAKAEQPGDAIHTEAWGGVGHADFQLTSGWKEYSTTGTINPLHGNLYFWNASANKNIYIRNIKIYEV